MMNLKPLTLDESIGLHENLAFWLAVLTPIIIAVILSLPIIIDEHLNFSFSSSGYGLFIDLFSFPISISSLSILFGIMIGRFHGSKQRGVSIVETVDNNILTNYYEHRGSFYNHIDKFDWKLTEPQGVRLKNPIKLYGLFFPSNSPENFTYLCNHQDFWTEVTGICNPLFGDPRGKSNCEMINDLFHGIGCECEEDMLDLQSAIEIFIDIIEYSLNFCDIDEAHSADELRDIMENMVEPHSQYDPRREY